MELEKRIGEKVINKKGIEGIILFVDELITVKYEDRTVKYEKDAFYKDYLTFSNNDLQRIVEESKGKYLMDKAIEEKKAEELKKQKELELTERLNKEKELKYKNIDVDKFFKSDYHVEYLTKQPILTYQQVEDQFKIRITGFSRGINITPNSVVLISVIRKNGEYFVYHDHWTSDGEYIYSGEGKDGDQQMNRGNKAIIEASRYGKKIFLFIKFSPSEYYLQGEMKLVDYQYEDDKDESGNIRKEYKFRLRKV